MRRHAEWMTRADERILEYLAENESEQPSEIRYGLAAINDAMAYPQSYVDGRLDRLAGAGLVAEREDGWAYELTNRGSFFLRGEFDASVLSPDAAELRSASPDSQARQDAGEQSSPSPASQAQQDADDASASDDRRRID